MERRVRIVALELVATHVVAVEQIFPVGTRDALRVGVRQHLVRIRHGPDAQLLLEPLRLPLRDDPRVAVAAIGRAFERGGIGLLRVREVFDLPDAIRAHRRRLVVRAVAFRCDLDRNRRLPNAVHQLIAILVQLIELQRETAGARVEVALVPRLAS